MVKAAVISSCGKYRYLLTRVWDMDHPTLPCILHNPSTADAERDDATIRKLVGFVRRYERRGIEYGGIRVYNLFAYRATHPADLALASDPVGPGNDACLKQINDTLVLCAWGNTRYVGREHQVKDQLRANGCDRICLGVTLLGCPCHPVRLPYEKATWEPF